MKLKIQVTEEDIKKGKLKDSSLCPIALASDRCIREYFKCPPDSIEVDGNIIFSIGNRIYMNKDSDEEIKLFINAFDFKRTVFPFEKEIEFREKEQEPDYDYED